MSNLCAAEINTAYDLGFITKDDRNTLFANLSIVRPIKKKSANATPFVKLTHEEKQVLSILKIMAIDDAEKWTTAHAIKCQTITLYGLCKKGLVFKKQDSFSTNVLWRVK